MKLHVVVFFFGLNLSWSTGLELNGQNLIGIHAGIHIPGAQDLKFKRFDKLLILQETVHTNRVSSNISMFNGLTFTHFGKEKFWHNKGVRLEVASWEFISRARGFFIKNAPPINEAEQHRTAALASLIRKFNPPSFLTQLQSPESNVYTGMGGGIVLTDVDPGKYEWNLGFQIFTGLVVPIWDGLKGLMEIKYVITHDADNNISTEPGWLVDTSGTSSWLRLGPHLDTRFLTIQAGIQWIVFN